MQSIDTGAVVDHLGGDDGGRSGRRASVANAGGCVRRKLGFGEKKKKMRQFLSPTLTSNFFAGCRRILLTISAPGFLQIGVFLQNHKRRIAETASLRATAGEETAKLAGDRGDEKREKKKTHLLFCPFFCPEVPCEY